MGRCWTSLIIREMKIKNTMRCHFTYVKMAVMKKTRDSKCLWACGEISQIAWYHLHVKSKRKKRKTQLTETKHRVLVVKLWWRWRKWGEVGKMVQTFSHETNKFWKSNLWYSDDTIVVNTIVYSLNHCWMYTSFCKENFQWNIPFKQVSHYLGFQTPPHSVWSAQKGGPR